jgi:hypothetical protein
VVGSHQAYVSVEWCIRHCRHFACQECPQLNWQQQQCTLLSAPYWSPSTAQCSLHTHYSTVIRCCKYLYVTCHNLARLF